MNEAGEAVAEAAENRPSFDLETLFRAQYVRVARVIARVVRDPARAEERAVEVFLKLWRTQRALPEQTEGWLSFSPPLMASAFRPRWVVMGTSGAVSSTDAQLIDSVLAAGAKSGYTFPFAAGSPTNGVIPVYTVKANPQVASQTGQRFFFTDQSGVIRFNLTASASVSDSPLQ